MTERYAQETFRAYARRLAGLHLDRHAAMRCLATAIEEDFASTQWAPRKHFRVEARGEDLAVVCLSDRAERWLRNRLQRGKSGELNAFAGRAVLLERPSPPPELDLEPTEGPQREPRCANLPPPPPDLDLTTCLYCDRRAREVLVNGEPRCHVHYTCGPDGRLPGDVRRSLRGRRSAHV